MLCSRHRRHGIAYVIVGVTILKTLRLDDIVAFNSLPSGCLRPMNSRVVPHQSRQPDVAGEHCIYPTPTSASAAELASWSSLFFGSVLALLMAATQNLQPASAEGDGTFNYDAKGVNWGDAFPRSMCMGKAQTPIDIQDLDIVSFGRDNLQRLISYKPVTVEVENNAGLMLQASGKFGVLRLPDGEYPVQEIHFHFPAEHTINGKIGVAEMHIVHQKTGSEGTNDIAVVGIIFDDGGDLAFGDESGFLTRLGFGGKLPVVGEKLKVDNLNLNAFQSEFKGGYYHYKGSLTTPPCSETVHWYVLQKRPRITTGMLDSWKQRFPQNNRELTPLNGRKLVANEVDVVGEFTWMDRDAYDTGFVVPAPIRPKIGRDAYDTAAALASSRRQQQPPPTAAGGQQQPPPTAAPTAATKT